MTQAVWIPGPLPGLNELLAAAKSGHGRGNAYARLKADWMQSVWAHAKAAHLKPMATPVRIGFLWVEKDRRRDPDNVAGGGRKLVLDGLVKAGVISDDGADEIRSWTDTFAVDKKAPGVRVELVTDDAIRAVGIKC
jgi:Holliday junction resolvase RusA-like endonuclease